MKHNIIFLFLLLPIMTLFGQTFNLQIGPTFSKLKWENSLVQHTMLDNNVTGINALLGIEFWDNKYFNLSSNLGFIQKGGKDSISVTSPLGEMDSMMLFKERLNYLTVNTAFIFKIPVKDVIFPYIMAGPRIDYLISYKENIAFIKQFEDADKVNYLIYGIIMGIGINYKFDKIQLGIVFNYYVNLNKMVDYTWENPNITNKISDNTFALNFQIGYKL